MQGKAILLKIVVTLAALSVHMRVSLPQYSVVVRYSPHGVSVTLARKTSEQVARESAAAGPHLDAVREKPAASEGRETPAPPSAGKTAAESQAAQSPPDGSTANAPASPEPASREPRDAPSQQKAAIEFMNIAPEGTSVLAGRAEPGSRVTVFENGVAVGEAVAGAEGDWSLATAHHFSSKDPSQSLSLSSRAEPQTPGRSVAAAGEAPRRSGEAPAAHDAVAGQGLASAVPGEAAARSVQRPAERVMQQFAETVEAARRASSGDVPAQVPPSAAQPVAAETARATSSAPMPAPQGTPAPQDAKSSATTIAAGGDATKPQSLTESNGSPPRTVPPEAAPAPAIIPIPMQFVFREATLTGDGEKAVALLLEYLKLKKYDDVTLSGHADERGSAEFNIELSLERLETVVHKLREGGYQGQVKLLPKGKSEPFSGIDRTRFAREDLMQLDRRVELRIAR